MASGPTLPTIGLSLTSLPTAGSTVPDVNPVKSVREAESVTATPDQGGGNAVPQGGQPLPQSSRSPEPTSTQLTAAVEGINRFLRSNQRQMVFEIDLKGEHQTLTIVNPATGEVIRQVPAVQVVQFASNLQQAGILMPGLFLNTRA
jgi:uncharacterized FlaG/YvyC family protein